MLHDPSKLAVAPKEATVTSRADGYVAQCDAMTIGAVSTRLGAGREKVDDSVDPGVGITLLKKIGEPVTAGEPLATVRFTEPARWERQKPHLESAWEIAPEPVDPPRLIVDRIS